MAVGWVALLRLSDVLHKSSHSTEHQSTVAADEKFHCTDMLTILCGTDQAGRILSTAAQRYRTWFIGNSAKAVQLS
jgi:hypothetical protein